MKNSLRILISFFVLFSLLAVVGCGEDSPEPAAAPEGVVGQDPAAELLDDVNIKDRFDRIESMIATMRAIPPAQIDAIPTVLNELKAKGRELERVLLVSGWSRVDPEAATKWVMKREKLEYVRSTMFNETVYAWAAEDPESLRSDFKIGLYSVRGWDPTMLRAFIHGWYDSGEPELETFIRDLGRNGDDQQRAISELIKVKLEKETPDEMIAWVTKLKGDERYRSYAYSRLAADIAAIDPQRAIAWCDEICDTNVGKDLPHWIASSWAREAGADAMDWLLARPETPAVRVGIRASYRLFQKTSPEEADAWLEKFPEEKLSSELFQGPVIMYVNRQSQLANNEVAIEWTKYIDNDWELERSLKSIAGRWLRRDEDAAKTWLATNEDLSDDVKAELITKHERYKKKAAKTREQRKSRPAWVKQKLAE